MWFPNLFFFAAQAQIVFSATTAAKPKPSKPSKATVFFIRHGEKPPFGDGLSTEGLQRSQCLRNVFAKNSTFNIDLIIAQQPQSGMPNR